MTTITQLEPSEHLRNLLINLPTNSPIACHILLASVGRIPWPVVDWVVADCGCEYLIIRDVRCFHRPALGEPVL